jgi:hypothetical protein
VYRTRQPGAQHWVTDRISGTYPKAAQIRVEAHIATGGARLFVVVYRCQGVFAAETSIRSTQLPKPTEVAPTNTCTGSAPSPLDPPLALAEALTFNHLGVLLPDAAADGHPALWTGRAGGTFTPGHPLPTTDSFVPAMASTERRNRIVVVGYGSNGTTKGIYVVTTAGRGQPWVGPTRIASLGSRTANYTIEAITANRGKTWVGLLRPVNRRHRGAMYVDRGNLSNEWTGALVLPHSTPQDRSLRLAYNHSSGHLHAAFTRIDLDSLVAGSGIMKERLLGHWTTPTFVTHWFRDYAEQITFTSHGNAVIGYTQR